MLPRLNWPVALRYSLSFLGVPNPSSPGTLALTQYGLSKVDVLNGVMLAPMDETYSQYIPAYVACVRYRVIQGHVRSLYQEWENVWKTGDTVSARNRYRGTPPVSQSRNSIPASN